MDPSRAEAVPMGAAYVQPPSLLMNNVCLHLMSSADTAQDQEGAPPSSDKSNNKENEEEGYKLKCKNPSIVRRVIHLGVLLRLNRGASSAEKGFSPN